MKKIFSFILLTYISIFCFAQTIIHKDAQIEKMVAAISKDSIQSYIKAMVGFGTRNTLSNQTHPAKGIGAARNWVLQKFNSFATNTNGRLTAYIDTVTLFADKRRIDSTTLLGNVMAVLKGTDTSDKRIFIITGHLDSRVSNVMNRISDAPGANDDASGCAAVIECARIMSQYNFSATIIFITVSGEEQGLLGAHFLAKKAKAQNWQIEAVLNNDIMGSNNSNETNIIDNTRLRVFSEGLPAFNTKEQAEQIRQMGWENDGKSRQLARYVKEIGERYVANLEVKLVYRNDRFLRGGDHTPFVEQGFAAVRFTEMNENYNRQHQDIRNENGVEYGDLEKFIDYDYLQKNIGINLSSLANLAKAPSMPKELKIDTKKLTNYTNLSWQAPTTSITKGYYVLIRETTEALWQKKIFTTKTNIDLPFSKDNYFFAVQAVNEDGNESLAVVPTVAR